MVLSSHEVELPQTILSAVEMVEADVEPVALELGPKSAVALTNGARQDESVELEFRVVRKELQPELIPLGMRGLDEVCNTRW